MNKLMTWKINNKFYKTKKELQKDIQKILKFSELNEFVNDDNKPIGYLGVDSKEIVRRENLTRSEWESERAEKEKNSPTPESVKAMIKKFGADGAVKKLIEHFEKTRAVSKAVR